MSIFKHTSGSPIASNRHLRQYPDPFNTYSSFLMPRTMDDVLRWCFIPETPVLMENGSFRNIEHVREGDMILSSDGYGSMVMDTAVREVDEDLCRIELAGVTDFPIQVTANHKLRVIRKDNKEAICKELETVDHEAVRADELEVGDFLVTAAPRADKPTVCDLPLYMLLLVGAYAAFGDLVTSGEDVWYTFPSNEYAKRFMNMVKNHAPDTVPAMVDVDGASVVLRCKELVAGIAQLIIRDDIDTNIFRSEVFGLDTLKRRALLAGNLFTCETRTSFDQDDLSVTSSTLDVTRTNLVKQLTVLSADVGVVSVRKCLTTGAWLVEHTPSKDRFHVDGYNLRQITNIARVRYSGPVHSLHVDGDHTYQVLGSGANNCEHIWYRNGTYARACQRIVAYFLTKIEVYDCSDDERDKYEAFHEDVLDTRNILSDLGADFLGYGNSFSSIVLPFRRYLRCDGCRSERPLKHLDYTFSGGKFTFTCQKCKKRQTTTKPIDRRSKDESDVYIKRWNPHEIHVRQHPVSGRREHLWQPPATHITKIKAGDPFFIEEYPWEMIKAVLDNKLFLFNKDVIFHMADEGLAGLDTGGWGIPMLLQNFSQAYYLQLAKLYNEVLFQEYIVPFRVISPAKGAHSPNADPMLTQNIGSFNRNILKMLNDHRKNPGGWYASPFPVEYQALGGEGMTINAYDHISAATDEMLNAMGVPVELYKGTLTIQTMPAALRLFEQTWPHLVAAFNHWLEWLMKNLAAVFQWDKAKARLTPVTWADDAERRQILLQLMAAGKISTQTVVAPLGIDSDEEIRRIMDEQRRLQEEQEKFQLEMQNKQILQQAQQSGAMQAAGMAQGMGPGAPGGMMGGMGGGGAGGPAPAITPEDQMAQADQIAQQLVSMPYEARRSELLKIKKSSEVLHALVKARMETTRNQAKSQGGRMMLAQGGPGGQPPMM